MTAEERAREIVSRRLSDLAQGDWQPVIAEAVRAAEAAEREACARMADEAKLELAEMARSELRSACDPRITERSMECASAIASAIRARGEPVP